MTAGAGTTGVQDAPTPGTDMARADQRAGVSPNGQHVSSLAADSVSDLLRLAVEKGTPVEQLEKLVDLHERMQERQARQEFFAALAAFQRECPQVHRDATARITTKKGGSYSYTFAKRDEIARTVAPYLAKYGLSYGFDTVVAGGSCTTTCTLRHVAGHSTTASFTLPVENDSGMSPQQKVGAADTYAQRRALSSVLGLTTTDEDADEADVDPTPISDDQVIILDDLINEIGVNRDRFLKYMNVSRLAEIRRADYDSAVTALEERRSHRRNQQ